ncbi:unnamed protein product [Brachionus calyciflorus]|uniref:Uncharacterized protein n=1 Tax=Brachionus calyciflorus TaxID=104777 RepID=A0A814IHP5_9BILA|nr:unnamed protein product [Brachionus calyciflorus]
MMAIFILLLNFIFMFENGSAFDFLLNNNHSISKCRTMLKNYFHVNDAIYLSFTDKLFTLDLTIKNFNSFSQINFQCINSAEFVYHMKIIPNRPLILDTSFNLNFAEPIKDNRLDIFIIQISFIDSFDIESQIFKKS